MSRPRLVCLVGPTASGKSELALELAEGLGGEIVSADSRQVYRGLDVGTAKPSAAEQARVRHHVLDLVEPTQGFDAGRFRALAAAAIGDAHERGRPPLVVGGTGLYVRALLYGLCPAPPRVPALRAALGRLTAERGAPSLHRGLAVLDPTAAARIAPNDVVRIVRALEVGLTSGRRLSDWQAAHRFTGSEYDALVIGVARSVPEIDARIMARLHAMVAAGFADEVAVLRDRGIPADAPGLRAVGYAEMRAWVEGRSSAAEALAAAVLATRRFAKRQRTWFRHQPDVLWRHPERDRLQVWREVTAFLADGVRPAPAAA